MELDGILLFTITLFVHALLRDAKPQDDQHPHKVPPQ
jgi:hypothetical protein